MSRTKPPTLRDVAQLAGVSVSTVSRYVSKSGYVDDRTGKKIASCIQEIDYQPNQVAQGLKLRRSNTILLVVPDICNPFYSTIAKTTQQLLNQKGYALVLYDSEEGKNEKAAIRLAHQIFASGILFGSIDISPDIITQIVKTNIPVVALNAYEQYPFDTVHVDGSNGSYLATRHLIELGHTRIGFAGGNPESMIGISRREGYLRAIGDAGLKTRHEDITEIGFTQLDGMVMGQYFIDALHRPTAICCANDLIALGVLSTMNAHGISVPQQVSIAGMDDILYAQVSSPSLTTVTNDGSQFAQEGIKMLFERIEKKYSGAPRSSVVHHDLVVRSSTAKPPHIGKQPVGSQTVSFYLEETSS